MRLAQTPIGERVRNGFAHDEIILHYQPQFYVPTGQAVALEALVRWDLGGRELVPPKGLMSGVADSELSMELLAHTLRLACAQGKTWQKARYRPIKIAISLSPEQLDHADLCPIIDSVMRDALPDIPWLELEIPLDAVLAGNGRTVRVLGQLKERGFPLVLDNYGCIRPELESLAALPIDKIKLDRSLTRRVGKDPSAAQTIRQALELRGRLAITVLAVGVETENVYRLLAGWGCNLVQGNLLSPALPPDRIASGVLAQQARKEARL